jgi:hypothetical protein
MTVDPTSPMVNPMTMRWLDTAPAWFREAFTVLWSQLSDIGSQLADITYKEQQVMAQVQVDQTDLDNLATNLESVKIALAGEIQNLQQQLPQANLGGLNQALSDLQALEPPTPTPAPTPTPELPRPRPHRRQARNGTQKQRTSPTRTHPPRRPRQRKTPIQPTRPHPPRLRRNRRPRNHHRKQTPTSRRETRR